MVGITRSKVIFAEVPCLLTRAAPDFGFLEIATHEASLEMMGLVQQQMLSVLARSYTTHYNIVAVVAPHAAGARKID